MIFFVNGSVLLLLLSSFSPKQVLLVHGAPLEHLVGGLPGQPDVGFKQYAGYINVDHNLGTYLFYYFVEARSNASSLPIALWLNGGPGCSSVGGGAFTELGPFYPNGKGNGLRINTQSWNRVANLLFLESPAGVGWSYSENPDGYRYNDRRVADESLVFLLRWFQRFPEYSKSQLFLIGESYAGHYIPQLALVMVKHNRLNGRRAGGGFRFNLKGIMVGNPLLNYGEDTSATYSYLWSHGLISDKTFKGVSRSCDFRYGYLGGDASKESGKGCPEFLDSAREEIGDFINMYDVTLNVCLPPIIHQVFRLHRMMGLGVPKQEDIDIDVCIDNEITRYLNEAGVQRALHANLSSLPYSWEACSRIIEYSSVDQLSDMLPSLARLLMEHRLRIWIFSGDQDSVVPLTGTRLHISNLAMQLKLQTTNPYRPWYAYGQVGGWYEAYGQELVYATVRGASHMVPYAQPERALVLFANFLEGKPLPSTPQLL